MNRFLAPYTIHPIRPDSTLKGDLRMDDLDIMCIREDMEKHFQKDLRDSTVEGWQVAGDVERTVRELEGVVA